MVKWILKSDDFAFSRRVDILMGLVKYLAKDESQRQAQVQGFAEGKNIIGKNWITRFLNRHPILSIKLASRIDRQRAYASNPRINGHFTKLGKVLRTGQFTPKAITNVDEEGFNMGVALRTHVVTCRAKKNPCVKQDGKREFITALEAVSAGGFLFPTYLIGKGSTHIFDCYKHVEAEDKEACWAVSPKG